MTDRMAFALGLITSALQTLMVMLSWVLTTYLGRRKIYVGGQAIAVGFLIALGIAASVPGASTAISNAQASLGLLISILFTLGPAPASWVIIGETSAIRLRPLTTGLGRVCYYLVNIPCIFLSSWMLNPTVRPSFHHTYHCAITDTTITGWQPWRQVRLRLGRHSSRLHTRSLVVAPRDEGPFVPRDRHSLQAQGPGPQVEEDLGRRPRRRVSAPTYMDAHVQSAVLEVGVGDEPGSHRVMTPQTGTKACSGAEPPCGVAVAVAPSLRLSSMQTYQSPVDAGRPHVYLARLANTIPIFFNDLLRTCDRHQDPAQSSSHD